MSLNIGIDHGYYAIKTAHFSFPAGIVAYSSEPYTLQNTLKYGGVASSGPQLSVAKLGDEQGQPQRGCSPSERVRNANWSPCGATSGGQYFVCGTGRQPVLRNKTANDNYYLLTLAAIAKELRQRGAPTTAAVHLAAGLPLTSYGREKLPFRDYLLRSSQPMCFEFEGIGYEITIEGATLFPQGYSALALYPDLLVGEPSILLMDIGGWTVDLMRLDNAQPNAATCRSLELGVIRCIDETAEQVRRDCGLSVTDSQIESVLNGRPCSLREDVQKIILRQGRSYTERLLSATMETGFDLGAMPVVMLGGGAAIVKRQIQPKDALCRPLYLLDDKVNAEGFERLLGQMSGSVGRA